jgi:hypothetical protein
VSLILEALKKLERDKQVEGRGGFLVMAARPWPSPSDDRRPLVWVIAGAVVMMAVGAGLALWLWRGTARPTVAQSAPPAPAAAPAAPVPMQPTAVMTAAPTAVAPVAAASLGDNTPRLPPVTRIVSPPAPAPAPAAPEIPATAAAVVAPPPAAPAGPAPRFRLTAISERDGKPVAMLNDRVVFEGDSFDDVTVVKIGVADVELKVAGKTVVVTFQ